MSSAEHPMDKPVGKQIGWRIVSRRKPLTDQRFTVAEDKIEIEGVADPVTFTYARVPAA